MYPIGEPPDEQQFRYDTHQAAELLGISPSEVMKLSHSGRLLFRYTGDRYCCRQADIDSYKRGQERRSK
jgi:excisionase family DNA binding protein